MEKLRSFFGVKKQHYDARKEIHDFDDFMEFYVARKSALSELTTDGILSKKEAEEVKEDDFMYFFMNPATRTYAQAALIMDKAIEKVVHEAVAEVMKKREQDRLKKIIPEPVSFPKSPSLRAQQPLSPQPVLVSVAKPTKRSTNIYYDHTSNYLY